MITRSQFREARHVLADCLISCALACLLMVALALALAWVDAALQGVIPSGAWGVSQGNHGPWRYAPILVLLLSAATFLLPLLALGGSLLAFLLRPSWLAFGLTLAGAATFWGMMMAFSWLID